MSKFLENALNTTELATLASIVKVGDTAYRELMENQRPMFAHPYFADTKSRIRTKLVQMQCEIESHDPKFPFEFYQRKFSYKQLIPELHTKNVILHIAQSHTQDALPYRSKYKVALSNNNEPLCRQMILDFNNVPPYTLEPFYGLVVFGGKEQTFSIIQFPEPEYKGIARTIPVPLTIVTKSEEKETFERKKAILKKEFLAHVKEVVS